MRQIPLGAKGSFNLLVQPEHLANRFKDAALPPVLATPVMIMIMEKRRPQRDQRLFRSRRERGRRCRQCALPRGGTSWSLGSSTQRAAIARSESPRARMTVL